MMVGVVTFFLISMVATRGLIHMIKKDGFGKPFVLSEITAIIRRLGWGDYII